jgi:hypothetical protein
VSFRNFRKSDQTTHCFTGIVFVIMSQSAKKTELKILNQGKTDKVERKKCQLK